MCTSQRRRWICCLWQIIFIQASGEHLKRGTKRSSNFGYQLIKGENENKVWLIHSCHQYCHANYRCCVSPVVLYNQQIRKAWPEHTLLEQAAILVAQLWWTLLIKNAMTETKRTKTFRCWSGYQMFLYNKDLCRGWKCWTFQCFHLSAIRHHSCTDTHNNTSCLLLSCWSNMWATFLPWRLGVHRMLNQK